MYGDAVGKVGTRDGEAWVKLYNGGEGRGGRREKGRNFFFQAEDGIRVAQESRGLGDVYERQVMV